MRKRKKTRHTAYDDTMEHYLLSKRLIKAPKQLPPEPNMPTVDELVEIGMSTQAAEVSKMSPEQKQWYEQWRANLDAESEAFLNSQPSMGFPEPVNFPVTPNLLKPFEPKSDIRRKPKKDPTYDHRPRKIVLE